MNKIACHKLKNKNIFAIKIKHFSTDNYLVIHFLCLFCFFNQQCQKTKKNYINV